jgi:hypothetical protein|tara:strand:- start:215 stop:436 length:222 start_codon:yes stop_codon:yes gene_type:complete
LLLYRAEEKKIEKEIYMKKLIMTVALLLTVLPTFAAVGENAETDCAAISGATHEEAQVQGGAEETRDSSSIDG